MTSGAIRPSVRSGGDSGGERTRVLVLGGLIVLGIIGYLVLNATGSGRDRDNLRNLLPYQVLARTLPESEQSVFRSIRNALPPLEAERVRLSRWPEASAISDTHRWEFFKQGTTVNYFGVPNDPAAPTWLLAIQEPEPGALPDPAPDDEEHHRLPDGTMLHIYVWTHRYGGQVNPRFVPQPQTDGWIEVFNVPPNPVLPPRR
jgi:hypothetical protein